MRFERIHGMKWLLMGIALILFALPYSSVNIVNSNFDFSTVLVGFSVVSPLVGLAFCIYGFLKRD